MLCSSGLVKASLIILRKHEFDKTSRDAVDIHTCTSSEAHISLELTPLAQSKLHHASPLNGTLTNATTNTYMALGLNVIGAIPGGAPRHF